MNVHALTLAVAVFVVGVDNTTFWHHFGQAVGSDPASRLGFTVAVAVFLAAALTGLMSLFTWRYLARGFLAFMLLLASVIAYFMSTYGIVIDDTMLANIVQTDENEAAGLFSAALVGHVLLTGVLPALAVCGVRVTRARSWRAPVCHAAVVGLALITAGAALASHYKDFALTLRDDRELRLFINPTYALYSAAEYVGETAEAGEPQLVHLGDDAHRTPDAGKRDARKILVVVVGETARAANWGLNGYRRATTPELAARGDIVNFPDAHACGTSTSISVPCMFAATGQADFDAHDARHTENLLDVLTSAGVSVRWQENQAGGCKGVCARIPTEDMRVRRIDGVYDADRCLDGVFLDGLAGRLADTRGDVVLVMHTMGSHGPAYHRRYPAAYAAFGPECTSNRPQDCSRDALIASYDNTLRYTDHVLAGIVNALDSLDSAADTALLYVSDHGESLGENGLYLHGFPEMVAPDEQTHIPMIAWFSPAFRRDSGLEPACVADVAQQRVSHDNLFDTVLGLMDVRAGIYRPARDLFAACRDAAIRP